MSSVTDLVILFFEEAAAYASVNVTSLETHKLYPIIKAKRIPTKSGPTVVLTLRVSETSIVQIFLPKCYSEVMSVTYIDDINSEAVSLHLVFIRFCESSKAYLLAIESEIYTSPPQPARDLEGKVLTGRSVFLRPKSA